MRGWNAWDLALLAIAAYVAAITLVRFMQASRVELLGRLRLEIQEEKDRLEQEKKKKKKAEKKRASARK